MKNYNWDKFSFRGAFLNRLYVDNIICLFNKYFHLRNSEHANRRFTFEEKEY